jgi:hypothetical protein
VIGGTAVDGKMDMASAQNGLVPEAGLLDDVLSLVDRAPLAPDGPERSIIRVRHEDRVPQILAGAGWGKTEMLVWRVLYQLLFAGRPADCVADHPGLVERTWQS